MAEDCGLRARLRGVRSVVLYGLVQPRPGNQRVLLKCDFDAALAGAFAHMFVDAYIRRRPYMGLQKVGTRGFFFRT